MKEVEDRKIRSENMLKQENIPYIDHLPPIESESESLRRNTEEVCNRAIALCLVACKGEGMDQDMTNDLVERFDIRSNFSPEEKMFIEDSNPTQHARVQFAWRYEAYKVLLWALDFIDTLDYPDRICDSAYVVSFLQKRSKEQFLKDSQLRLQKELLDEADLVYRYHWATQNARIQGEEIPANLDSGVVLERHDALNWLIGAEGISEWDEVSTNT